MYQQIRLPYLIQGRLKDSTSSVGNLRINPTVSDSKNGKFSIMTLRTVVSNVANNLFSAKTSLLLNKFIKVDLPAPFSPHEGVNFAGF